LLQLAELADPGAKGFIFRSGEALFLGFVVRVGQRVRGFVDRCPHAGMPLAFPPDRYLTREGDAILCATHGALFDLEGLCVGGPCAGLRLRDWPVRVEAGAVVVAEG
jgi:nitrite reductase/ring-hydroxylating ferredoxin subunit